MANVVLRPWVKVVGVVAIVAAIMFGASKFFGSGDDSSNSGGLLSGLFSSDDDVITVGTNTYAGFLPFMYLNGGLEPNEDCPIYKEYGIKLKIVVQDDFAAGRAAFKNGDIDVIYCTADALPVEMSEGSDMNDSRFFNISNWSRGADAIVVNKSISNVSDLIGKVVCCSQGTASHTLLLNTLETNGIGADKVNTGTNVLPDKVNIKVVDSGLDAASVFRSGSCDAAVVFSPDDQDLVATVKGAKVLISTKQASNIICDGLIAKVSYLDSNKEKIQKLVAALLWANDLMNSNPDAVKTAAKAFAKSYGTDEQFAIDGSKNIHYITLGDAQNFFGLNSSYTGMQGDELYSKMARTYEQLGLCKKPLSWRKVSYPDVIEALAADAGNVKGNQAAEAGVKFKETTEEKAAEAVTISDKKVTIEYASNSDVLDGTAQAIIDKEFAGIAKQFAGSKIRIVGNTDNTGNYDYNVALSKRRAQAVANYLVKEYGFDKNRFIIVGDGPKRAIADGVQGDNKAYRSTDFQLVAE